MTTQRSDKRWDIVHIDVKQASATCISDGDKTYLIDADRASHVDDIKSELDGNTIDAAFITHGHSDHIAGMKKLVKSDDVEIDRLYGPNENLYDLSPGEPGEHLQQVYRAAENRTTEVKRVDSFGQEGPVKYDVPHEDTPIANNDGLVARVGSRGNETVILGDSTPDQLARIDDEFLRDAETVVAPHHGSRNNFDTKNIPEQKLREQEVDPAEADETPLAEILSEDTRDQLGLSADADKKEIDDSITTREDFDAVADDLSIDYLEQADPDNFVVSSDPEHMDWGHPNKLTMAAVEGSDVNCDVYHTDRHGDIYESSLSNGETPGEVVEDRLSEEQTPEIEDTEEQIDYTGSEERLEKGSPEAHLEPTTSGTDDSATSEDKSQELTMEESRAYTNDNPADEGEDDALRVDDVQRQDKSIQERKGTNEGISADDTQTGVNTGQGNEEDVNEGVSVDDAPNDVDTDGSSGENAEEKDNDLNQSNRYLF
ncbi:ComEC/Rec2 family competence protein [Natronorubrum thiooxidans]|uniref:Metallo-beta-lactamase superfamily protein n=1 Tax=Natronorubrum thiooxidans TaxID=308853 RepID=A0A1N7H3F2_9EURY|nr:MBL fold metallo-hydrolase [Natronorubrum thiooxidans]SIS19290.1 Metallo-beta-lactamase superfamily protein [Natronorubrum thiooxidans]